MRGRIDRRRFIRGTGVALALPWLECLAEPAAHVSKQAKRLAVVFMANGVNPQHWWARERALGKLEFSDVLSSLEPLSSKINFFKGLWNPNSIDGVGVHVPKMNVLSGLTVQRSETQVGLGKTMDQIVAHEVGREFPLSSLVVGTESPMLRTEGGYNMLYSAYVSWESADRPAAKLIAPRDVFEKLVGESGGSARRLRIMDRIREDARALNARLSYLDRDKLDEYLTSVDEIEQRIRRFDKYSRVAYADRSVYLDKPDLERPPAGIPDTVDEHMRLQFELLLLAFRMNKTSVASFMMNNDLSGMDFSFLNGVSGGHHEISHHSNNQRHLEMYRKVNTYHMELFSAFITRMESIREGEGSMLDNSLVLFCSSLMDGNIHDSTELPILLAGGQAAGVRGGRVHDFSRGENRKLCRLHLALMERMGVSVDSFGDAREALVL